MAAKRISKIMTSVFDVIDFEDANDQTKVRQAMALASQRVSDRFGTFVRQGSVDDQAARFSLVEEDVRAVVAAACEQVGYVGGDEIYKAITNNFVTGEVQPLLRTAGVRHEARKPKMCPYHSEVTDISLAAGDPSAGFNAMAQHAWGANHCQGGEYEGGKCNFKPAMTTQTFWDEKAEKAQQRRDERAEREQQELQQEQEWQGEELPEVETPTEPAELEGGDLAEPTPIHDEPSAIGEGVSDGPSESEEVAIPMAMAASVTKVAQVAPGRFEVVLAGKDGYSATFTVNANDEYEARQVAIRQNVAQGGQSGWATKVADTATPIPKMDKRKWTPKTVPALTGVDDDDGRHPTKRKDVVDPITQTPDKPDNKSELKEIGEQVTEHQDVAEDTGVSTKGQGGTFPGGSTTAVSSTLLSTDRVREALEKSKRK